jgi:hypothetical protein
MLVQYGELGDTLYFGYVGNDTSGSAADGTTPLYDVRLAGAAASAAPVLSGTPTLLTHANYGPGCTEIDIDATSGNGFSDGSTYLVFATETNDGQTPGALVGIFSLGKLQSAADTGLMIETTVASVPTTTQITLTDGSDIDDDYNNKIMVFEDTDNVNRQTTRRPTDYTGSTKTLDYDSAVSGWTVGIGDKVRIFAFPHPDAPNSDVTAVKNKTDNLAFSVSSQADVNVKSIQGTTVTGSGTDADPWGED